MGLAPATTTLLASIRPDEWELPLFIHVLSAFVLIGAVTLALVALAGGWRSGSAQSARLAFRALLWAVIPAWIVMRLTAQWLLDKQGLEDADFAWIEIGFMSAEPTFLPARGRNRDRMAAVEGRRPQHRRANRHRPDRHLPDRLPGRALGDDDEAGLTA